MKMHRIGALVTAAVISASAEGAVLVSNLAEPTIPGDNDTNITLDFWARQTFATDNNAYDLVDIQTVLGDSTPGTGIVAELRDYATGTLLTTMTVPSLAGVVSVKTLTPDNPVTLDPNTTYALVLGVSGGGSFYWRYAEGINSIGPGSLLVFGYSTDQGANFQDYTYVDPYMMQVNVDLATPADVPEPSTLALSLSALIAVSMLRLLQLRRRPEA